MPFVPHTEEEVREMLDAFVETMKSIQKEAETNPGLMKGAPYTLPVRRIDDMRTTRDLDLTWVQPNG